MHQPVNQDPIEIGIQPVIGVTIKTSKRKVITDAHIYKSVYDIQKREREVIQRRHAEVPPHLSAIMGSVEASKYLGVTRATLKRWHEREVLPAMVNESNGYKTYLLSHLWVFKMLWLEDQNGS